jgi:hypothetical protein
MENKAAALKNIFNLSTGLLVLLNIVTLGIYPLIWLWQRRDAANTEVGAELISEAFLIVMMIMTALNIICTFAGYGGFFGLAMGIGWVIYAFRARTILVDYAAKQFNVNLNMNAILTFFFTVFYITYCINARCNAC